MPDTAPAQTSAPARDVETRPIMRQLAERRRALGLTQQDVADVTGKAQSTVSGWETGTYDPALLDIEDYARLVGCRLTLTPRDQHGSATVDGPSYTGQVYGGRTLIDGTAEAAGGGHG